MGRSKVGYSPAGEPMREKAEDEVMVGVARANR